VRAYGIHVGNSDSRGARQYSYDSADRLTAVNAVGGASLSYDAAGRLGALVANGVSTRFVYDGGQLTGEVDGNGVMIRRYVPLPGPDETLAMYDSTGVSYPLADSRGTPMAWTLANGQIAVQQYGAFGEEGPANIGRFGFTGQMRLPEIGLDYYKARFYDPQIGRFLTPDPAGTIDSPNLYAYVLNDPVNNTDPSGLRLVCTVTHSAFGSRGTCSEVPDNPPGRGGFIGQGDTNGGLNGGPGQAPPGMGEMMAMERARERLCAQINDAANRTRSNLPTNPNASTVEGLRFERAVAQLDLNFLEPINNTLNPSLLITGTAAGVFAAAGTGEGFAGRVIAIGRNILARRAVTVGAGAVGVAAFVIDFSVDRDKNRIAAINAQLLQKEAKRAGVCS
jgi:RHS repeat-associated protein